MSSTLDAKLPSIMEPVFAPSRYKVLYGGRGGAKSWSIARALLIQGAQRKMRILCAREFQSSIQDSVHKLLSDQILEMGMDAFYTVEKATIFGLNGTEFRFAGIRTNIGAIKSFEGIDVAWCEEAANVSKHSWMTLIPTIRKDGSEIWVSFNPELEDDETYQRFVVNPPSDAWVQKIGWEDNPWFPETLQKEAMDLKERSLDDYLHIYGGHCKHTLDGAVFAKEMRDAETEARFTRVPYVSTKPVDVYFDLGRRDMCSAWFTQQVGFEYRFIDFYEACGHVWSHYLKMMQERPYVYGTIWLPHDADHDLLASDRSITKQTREVFSRVRVIPRVARKNIAVEAGRSVFAQCWFDREKCADGIQHLRHYQFEVDVKTGQRGKEPLHDEHSHAADAFMQVGMAMQEPKPKGSGLPDMPVRNPMMHRAGVGTSWMGR